MEEEDKKKMKNTSRGKPRSLSFIRKPIVKTAVKTVYFAVHFKFLTMSCLIKKAVAQDNFWLNSKVMSCILLPIFFFSLPVNFPVRTFIRTQSPTSFRQKMKVKKASKQRKSEFSHGNTLHLAITCECDPT